MYWDSSRRKQLISILVLLIIFIPQVTVSAYYRRDNEKIKVIASKQKQENNMKTAARYDDTYHRHLENLKKNIFLVDDLMYPHIFNEEVETYKSNTAVVNKQNKKRNYRDDTITNRRRSTRTNNKMGVQKIPSSYANTEPLNFTKLIRTQQLEKIKDAAKLLDAVSKELYSQKHKIKLGGLYEEYKRRLQTILDSGKKTRNTMLFTSESDNPFVIDNKIDKGIRPQFIEGEELVCQAMKSHASQPELGSHEPFLSKTLKTADIGEFLMRTALAKVAASKIAATQVDVKSNVSSFCLPAQTPPVQSSPVQTAPAQTTSAQTAPVQTTSAQTAPVQTVSAQAAPDQCASGQCMLVQCAPIKCIPVQCASIQFAPTQFTPIQSFPDQGSSIQNVPIQMGLVPSSAVQAQNLETLALKSPSVQNSASKSLLLQSLAHLNSPTQAASTHSEPITKASVQHVAPISENESSNSKQTTNYDLQKQRMLFNKAVAHSLIKSQQEGNILVGDLNSQYFRNQSEIGDINLQNDTLIAKKDSLYKTNMPAEKIRGSRKEVDFLKIHSMKNSPQLNKTLFSFPDSDQNHIKDALKAIEETPIDTLYDEYQKQLNNLNEKMKLKKLWWEHGKVNRLQKVPLKDDSNMKLNTSGGELKRRNCAKPMDSMQNETVSYKPRRKSKKNLQIKVKKDLGRDSYPQVLTAGWQIATNPSTCVRRDESILSKLAHKMNMSPTDLAQKLTTAANSNDSKFALAIKEYLARSINPSPNVKIDAHDETTRLTPTNSDSTNRLFETRQTQQQHNSPALLEAKPPAPPAPPSSPAPDVFGNLAPVLEKILTKLEGIQEVKCCHESGPTQLPKCESDPTQTNGAPCKIIGSWESSFLGVRFDIAALNKTHTENDSDPSQPSCKSTKRNCGQPETSIKNDSILSIKVFETTPPRQHEVLDNIHDWYFNGISVNLLGGPLAINARKANSSMMATFIGYCRTCGCIDTIYGSWSFCTPSRDCSDIITAIFEKRDLLRRYKMIENRKEHYKDYLFVNSKFYKNEKMQMENKNKNSCS